MIAVALLMPPLLLCLVLALGRYEDHILRNGFVAQPRHALPKRRLHAVPELPSREPPPSEDEERRAA